MSSLEVLQQRLERFREAGRNLQLDPLVTHEALNRLGVEYQVTELDRLEQAIEDCVSQDNKLIFTGHRGCGKSTLLAELGFRLEETNRYCVVNFSIADTIERSAVDHVNILFSVALQMLELAEKREVPIQPGIKTGFYRWLGKHTQTESTAVVKEIESGVEVEGGIPIILKFLAKIKSTLKINSSIRQEISTEFARRTSDLVDQINQLQTYIEKATGQQILVIIDDLDKLDLSVTETIFSKNIQSLLDPHLRIIYTLPVATLREIAIKSSINSYFKQIHTMKVAKFFSKADVRKPDRKPDESCVQIFSKILDRRLPEDLMETAVKQQIILLSGGVLRELIRICDRCCDKAMQELRRRIRRQEWSLPEVKVNQQILDDVVRELRIEYAEVLGKVDFDALRIIYEDFRPQDAENQRFLDLLHGLYVLEYQNDLQWYDLNPIVRDLLVREGMLNGTTL
jgi:nucleoside-triphosphatase THEP1